MAWFVAVRPGSNEFQSVGGIVIFLAYGKVQKR